MYRFRWIWEREPIVLKPTPSDGKFVGQACYGYVSFEALCDAAAAVNSGELTLDRCDRDLPTMASTAGATAILEELDANGAPFDSKDGAPFDLITTGRRVLTTPPAIASARWQRVLTSTPSLIERDPGHDEVPARAEAVHVRHLESVGARSGT